MLTTLFENELILVQFNKELNAVIVTNKNSDIQDNKLSVRAYDDGHLSILSNGRYHPRDMGFDLWLN